MSDDILAASQQEARDLFKHQIGKAELKPLAKPCHDCAVECGFYLPFAEALSMLPKDEVEYHSRRWFCHENPGRSCAGNISFQKRQAREE